MKTVCAKIEVRPLNGGSGTIRKSLSDWAEYRQFVRMFYRSYTPESERDDSPKKPFTWGWGNGILNVQVWVPGYEG